MNLRWIWCHVSEAMIEHYGNVFVANYVIVTVSIIVVMAALWSRAGHYIFVLWFLLLSFFSRLISAVGDWMSAILPHMVWP